jgi:hypothetical protein
MMIAPKSQSPKHWMISKASATAIGLLMLAGCQAVPNTASRNMQSNPMAHDQSRMTSVQQDVRSSQAVAANDSYVAQASYQMPVDGADYGDPELARLPMPQMPGMMPVAYPASHVHSERCPHCSGQSYQPVYANGDFSNCGVAGCGTSSGPCNVCPPALPGGIDPQEYIFDGGDQDPAVRIKQDYSLVGLGPEDTVVEFTTEDGREYAETGCRTAIYAPRFASVRRIQSYGEQDGVLAARATLKQQPAIHVHAPTPPLLAAKKQGPIPESNVDVVEAFRERNRGVPILMNQAPRGWSNFYKPYEDLQLIRTGEANTTEGPQLIKYATNAIAWSTVDELMVLVDNAEAELVVSEDHPEEIFTYELGGARIRMCKVASQQSANVGDVVDVMTT